MNGGRQTIDVKVVVFWNCWKSSCSDWNLEEEEQKKKTEKKQKKKSLNNWYFIRSDEQINLPVVTKFFCSLFFFCLCFLKGRLLNQLNPVFSNCKKKKTLLANTKHFYTYIYVYICIINVHSFLETSVYYGQLSFYEQFHFMKLS